MKSSSDKHKKKFGKNHNSIRNEIINIATHIFSLHGYKKTNIEDIAKACKRGHSFIYYYFRSKEEVFRSVIDNEFQLLMTDLKEILNLSYDPQQKLRIYLTSRMNKMKTVSNLYNTLKNDFFDSVPYVEAIQLKFDQQEFSIICAILKEGKDRNIFHIENTDSVTQAIMSAMWGLEIPFFIKQVVIDIDNRIDELLIILFYGLIKR